MSKKRLGNSLESIEHLHELIAQSRVVFGKAIGDGVQMESGIATEMGLDVGESEETTADVIGDQEVGLPVVAVAVAAAVAVAYYRRRKKRSMPINILGALKSLPGTPREFEFKDLKKATNNFDEKNKLAGKQVYIEERRANSSGASRGGGRRGRGRASYQSEAPRGRFGGRSFGRGGYGVVYNGLLQNEIRKLRE
ncbi:unnamed protein product [Camellia sinensis]